MPLRDIVLGPYYLLKAMATTFKHNARPVVTIEYPERQKPVPPRARGRHILHRYADGLEKCVGCELCAIACPVGCIVVEAAVVAVMVVSAWEAGALAQMAAISAIVRMASLMVPLLSTRLCAKNLTLEIHFCVVG